MPQRGAMWDLAFAFAFFLTLAPTKADGTAACADKKLADGTAWHDIGGILYTCAQYYTTTPKCTQDGSLYAFSGMTATQACCTCGGGTTTGSTPTTTTGAPTRPVTATPTRAGVTTSPSLAPTPAASRGRCTDVLLSTGAAWHDNGGIAFTCAGYYVSPAKCTQEGSLYSFGGYSANTACCTCGGGVKGTVSTSSPTSSPSVSASTCVDKTLTSGAPWHDNGGVAYSCVYYSSNNKCVLEGNSYAFGGLTATQACCGCGGGTTTTASCWIYPGLPNTCPSGQTCVASQTISATQPTPGNCVVSGSITPTSSPTVTANCWITSGVPDTCPSGQSCNAIGAAYGNPSITPGVCTSRGTPTSSPTTAVDCWLLPGFPTMNTCPSGGYCNATYSATAPAAGHCITNTTYSWSPTLSPTLSPSGGGTSCWVLPSSPNLNTCASGQYCRLTAVFSTTSPTPGTCQVNTTVSASPASAATAPSGCQDMALRDGTPWHDNGGAGFNCAYYNKTNNCLAEGALYPFQNMTAQTACCVCGGGTGRACWLLPRAKALDLCPNGQTCWGNNSESITVPTLGYCIKGNSSTTAPTPAPTATANCWIGNGLPAFCTGNTYCSPIGAAFGSPPITPGRCLSSTAPTTAPISDEVCWILPGFSTSITCSSGYFCSPSGPLSTTNPTQGRCILNNTFVPTPSPTGILGCWILPGTTYDLCPAGFFCRALTPISDSNPTAGTCNVNTSYTASPTRAPTYYRACQDVPLANGSAWHDNGGTFFTCAGYYAQHGRCASDGSLYAFEGKTANIACCACGGGTKGCVDETLRDGTPWHDASGSSFNCQYYANAGKCASDGNNYANEGLTAHQACCVCGGGAGQQPMDATSLGIRTATVVVVQFSEFYELHPVANLGGAARLGGLLKQLRAQHPYVYTVLAGDVLSPSALSYANVSLGGGKYDLLNGRQMIDIMNQLSVDVAVFGPHEFDLPDYELASRLSESKTQWLNGNILFANNTPYSPTSNVHDYVTLNVPTNPPIHLSFLGATAPFNNGWAWATNSSVAIEEDYQMSKWPPLATSHAVIGLTHQALEDDIEFISRVKVAAVMGGDDNGNYQAWKANPVGGLTPIFKSSPNARGVYVHYLNFVRNTSSTTSSSDWELKNIDSDFKLLDSTIPESSKISQAVDSWTNMAFDYFRTQGIEPTHTIGIISTALDGRNSVIQRGPTLLTNLVAQSMFSCASSAPDAVIFDVGIIKFDDVIPALANLTNYDVLRILPAGGKVYSVILTGKALITALSGNRARQGTADYSAYTRIQRAGPTWQIVNRDGTWAAIDNNTNYTIATNGNSISGEATCWVLPQAPTLNLCPTGQYCRVTQPLSGTQPTPGMCTKSGGSFANQPGVWLDDVICDQWVALEARLTDFSLNGNPNL